MAAFEQNIWTTRSVKLAILSDLHLRLPGEADYDFPSQQRLDAAIECINVAYGDIDLVVIAGDMVHDARDLDRYERTLEAYQFARDSLRALQVPWTMTMGNHDNRDAFKQVFGNAFSDEDGFIQSAHAIDGHRVILLDSLEKNASADSDTFTAPFGHLCEKRLKWLDQQLHIANGAPVIVILHHPVLPLQVTNDPSFLKSPTALVDRLEAYGNVRQVISGHVHMTTTTFHRKIAFTTLSGGATTAFEAFGTKQRRIVREGSAQMAIVLSDSETTTLHFETYFDRHEIVE